MTITICIADRESRVRHGLRIFLEQQPGWNILGEAADSQELLKLVKENCPDLILLDLDLPGIPADILLANLNQVCPRATLILLSGRYELRQAALKTGAHAFASKTDPPERLLTLIRGVCSSERSSDSV